MIWLAALLLVVLAFPFVRGWLRPSMNGPAHKQAPGQFARLSGGITHYEWHGPATGPVIVCVHGLTTPSFVWRGMTQALAQSGYRVLTYDHYGRGYSSSCKGLQDRAFFFNQLNELLDHEEVAGPLSVIGYSMGGAVSAAFAASYPDRVRRLILLAPAGMGTGASRLVRFIKQTPVFGDWLFFMLYPGILRKGIEAERDLPSSVPDIGELQTTELEYRGFLPAVLSSIRGILSEPLEADHRALATAGTSVLAIWGSQDDLIPLSAVDRLRDWNKDAQQEIIEGAGHGIPYTHTVQTLRIIQDWLAANP